MRERKRMGMGKREMKIVACLQNEIGISMILFIPHFILWPYVLRGDVVYCGLLRKWPEYNGRAVVWPLATRLLIKQYIPGSRH